MCFVKYIPCLINFCVRQKSKFFIRFVQLKRKQTNNGDNYYNVIEINLLLQPM